MRDTAEMVGGAEVLTSTLQVVRGVALLLGIQGFPGRGVLFLSLQFPRLLQVLDGRVHHEVDVVHQQAAEVPVAALAPLLSCHPLPAGLLCWDCPQIRCNHPAKGSCTNSNPFWKQGQQALGPLLTCHPLPGGSLCWEHPQIRCNHLARGHAPIPTHVGNRGNRPWAPCSPATLCREAHCAGSIHRYAAITRQGVMHHAPTHV